MCRVEMLFEMLLHALGFGKEGAVVVVILYCHDGPWPIRH